MKWIRSLGFKEAGAFGTILLKSDDTLIFQGRTLVACPRRNQYIKSHENGTQTCVPCEPCGKGKQRKRCSLWQGSECEPCPEGSFNDKVGNKCKPCTVCSPGYFIYHKCTRHGDAICSACPNRTYSSEVNSPHCKICIHCRANEERLHKCNSTNNYSCGDCIQEYYRDSATGSCLPCAKCRGNDTSVVPECYKKNKGYSDKNCMLSNRGIDTQKSDSPGVYLIEDRIKAGTTLLLTVILSVIVFCTILLTASFICIHSSRNTQKCIREVRDFRREKDVNLEKTAIEPPYDCKQDSKIPWVNEWLKKFLSFVHGIWASDRKLHGHALDSVPKNNDHVPVKADQTFMYISYTKERQSWDFVKMLREKCVVLPETKCCSDVENDTPERKLRIPDSMNYREGDISCTENLVDRAKYDSDVSSSGGDSGTVEREMDCHSMGWSKRSNNRRHSSRKSRHKSRRDSTNGIFHKPRCTTKYMYNTL